jgi:hypothetical protein
MAAARSRWGAQTCVGGGGIWGHGICRPGRVRNCARGAGTHTPCRSLLGGLPQASRTTPRPVVMGPGARPGRRWMVAAYPQTQFRFLAARCARSFAFGFALERRGRREDRVRAAPAVPCAISTSNAHTSIQVQRKHSGLPRAMVLRLMPCSPRRRIPLVTVIGELAVLRSPVGLRKPPPT